MTDPRIQEWLNRLPRNGPWLVTLLLAALIAVELARATLLLVSSRQVRTVQAQPLHTGNAVRRAAINIGSIASAHLFGTYVPDSAAQDPSNAPLSSANLVLAGTIATNDPKRGVAIIGDGGPSKVYSVGDNVSGASLHSVYLDHVILDRGGNLETLLLPRQLPPSRPPIVARSNAPAQIQNLRRMVEKDPAILSQVMRAVPSYDSQAGKLRGFRIYPGKNRSAFNNLGLRPGDLVTAINGTTLDDPQHGQEIMNTLDSSDRATVTIERGGQMQDLTLNVSQVASEATEGLSGAGNAASGTPAMAPAAGAARGLPFGARPALRGGGAGPGSFGAGTPAGGNAAPDGDAMQPAPTTPAATIPPPAPEPEPSPDGSSQ
jgi:general secretion pathway protein C